MIHRNQRYITDEPAEKVDLDKSESLPPIHKTEVESPESPHKAMVTPEPPLGADTPVHTEPQENFYMNNFHMYPQKPELDKSQSEKGLEDLGVIGVHDVVANQDDFKDTMQDFNKDRTEADIDSNPPCKYTFFNLFPLRWDGTGCNFDT